MKPFDKAGSTMTRGGCIESSSLLVGLPQEQYTESAKSNWYSGPLVAFNFMCPVQSLLYGKKLYECAKVLVRSV